MDELVQVSEVCVNFGKNVVLNNVSAVFLRGKAYGIIGNNGSGKTVLMKCISGFIIPDKGLISVNGRIVGKDIDFSPNTGILIETPGFLPGLSGYGNLRLLAGIRNLIDDKEIRDTMKLVGLDPDNKNRVANYSLGMRQRLGIAQAIMENPDLLILDEPFNGLDKNGIVEMRNLLKKLCEGGKTIIMSSHNPYDIETICDKVFEVEGGKLFER